MKKLFVPLLLYCAVVAAVFGKALLPPEGQLIYGDDIHHQYYYYRQFFNDFFKQGIFPWWNPYNFSGAPFIANPVVNIWYPPTWLFIFFPLNTAYSWHIALHLIWAMLGMYVFISKFKIQNSKLEDEKEKQFDIGAFVAGLVFGLSGFYSARVWAGHVDVIAAASWMPWVIGAFSAEIKNQKSKIKMIIAGTVFSMQLYAGYQTMALLTLEAVGIVTLLHCYIVKNLRPLLRATVAVIIGLGLAGLQIIPEQEFFLRSVRTFDFPYSWISYGAKTFESFKQLFTPFIFGDQLTYHGVPPNYAEHAMFIGIVPLVFLFVSLFRSIPFLVIIMFSLWVSLGPNAPVDLQKMLWQIFPPYQYLRLPSRHLILFVFSASVLIGLGLSQIRLRLAQMAVAILVAIELIPFARHFVETRDIPDKKFDQALIATVKKGPEPVRLLQNFGVWVDAGENLDFDAAPAQHIFSASGYDPSILRHYYEFIDVVNGSSPGSSITSQDVQIPYVVRFNKLFDFLNIKYLLVLPQYDPFGGRSAERFKLIRDDQAREFRLYESTSTMPRFFFASKLTSYTSRGDMISALQKKDADVETVVHALASDVPQAPSDDCPQNQGGKAQIVSYSPNEIVLSAEAPCDGYLVSSEVFYPGWEATVDGKKQKVFEGNLAFRAIRLLQGEHTIVYQYVPMIFYLGAAVTIISGVVCFLWYRLSPTSRF